MSEVKMLKTTELASLVYTRDSDGQVKKTTSKGLPGAEITENTYDENNRLTKYGSTEYKYDAANNPTKEGASTNTFNEGDELQKGTGVTYAYDGLDERTKTTPEKGGATTYGYDQTGDLTSVERPEGESKPKSEDTYAYNGEGCASAGLARNPSKRVPRIMSAEREQPTKRDEMQAYRKRAAHRPWGGLVALAVVSVALLARASALGHHNQTAADILRGIAMVAVVVSIGLLFRWAVLRERAKSSDQKELRKRS